MKSVLNFLNVLDSEGRLSITNLAVIIVLIKITIAPTASIVEMGALFISLANYHLKRKTIADSRTVETPEDVITPQVNELQKKLEETISQVSALTIQSGIKKLGGN